MKIRNAAWKIENSRIAKYVGHFAGLKIVEFESLGEWDSFHPSQGVKIMRRSSLSFLQKTSLAEKNQRFPQKYKKKMDPNNVSFEASHVVFFGEYIGTYQTFGFAFRTRWGGFQVDGVVAADGIEATK